MYFTSSLLAATELPNPCQLSSILLIRYWKRTDSRRWIIPNTIPDASKVKLKRVLNLLLHLFLLVSLSIVSRTQASGNRLLPRDEHAFPILVLLPPRKLQPKNVRGVQDAGPGGWRGRVQVRIFTVHLSSHSKANRDFFFLQDTAWNASSASTATV